MIDQLIERNKKIGLLLLELKIMIEVEKHEYCIRMINKNTYELIKVKTRELVKIDTIDRIKSWLGLRKITSVIEYGKL